VVLAHGDRTGLIQAVEGLRNGRKLIVFFNFDRQSIPPVPGIGGTFSSDVKEPMFRVLLESLTEERKGIDLCIYTRGGDTNSVWPLVSLLREYDTDFQVLVPFRCHSAGTLLSLAASKIIMCPISELSPIDPSTGNQFNPRDSFNHNLPLAISVEDVNAFRDFVRAHYGEDFDSLTVEQKVEILTPSLNKLLEQVHPLALGNVQRAHMQIRKLAHKLLRLGNPDLDTENIINSLTSDMCSHLHMINRHEAQEIFGKNKVIFAEKELSEALNVLLYKYEKEFKLRETFVLQVHMGSDLEKEEDFLAGVVESDSWSYVYKTKVKITQSTKLPSNVQVQIPPGQPLPLIPGLPKHAQVDILSQGWTREYPIEEGE